jgi:hypothetical protein
MLLLCVAIPVFAQVSTEWKLPPVIYLPVAAGIAILSVILGRIPKSQGFSMILRNIRQNFLSYEAIDDAAAKILSSVGVPEPFKTWVAKTIAQIITTLPNGNSMPVEQVADVVASRYSSLSIKDATKLLPIPRALAATTFASKRIAKKVITQGNLV